VSDKANVEMYVSIPLAPTPARDAMIAILDAIGRREPPYERVALTLGLSDLHLPIEGSVSIPIEAGVEAQPLRWECRIEIEAEQNRELFPHFEGTLTVTPNGRGACELRLQGSYDPPLGLLGKGLDATVLRGAAERALRRFLEWLATEIRARVDRLEREHAQRIRSR
jgi:hypothetical protein